MDVYQIFYEYHFIGKLPFYDNDNSTLSEEETKMLSDENIFQLVSLMYSEKNVNTDNIIDERKICKTFSVKNVGSKEKEMKSGKIIDNRRLKNFENIIKNKRNERNESLVKIEEMPTESEHSSSDDSDDGDDTDDGDGNDGSEITDIGTEETVQRKPIVNKKNKKKESNEICPYEMKFACDTIFTQFHAKRIQSLANILNANVSMDWVKVVASKIKPEQHDDSGFKMLHRHKNDKKENRHIHIYGTVKEFIKQYINATDDNIITFSLYNSEEAIHIQDLKKQLQKFISVSSDETSSLLLLMASCSIGIPTRKMYTPKEFMTKWKNCKYKKVNNSNIVCTILKGKVSFDENINGVEYQQLIHNYNKNKQYFLVSENKNKTPLGYFATQWYSYPDDSDLRNIFTHLNDVIRNCMN